MTLAPGLVQAIFLAAFEQKNLADRAAVLDRECANDEGLRRRVEALLVAHDEPYGLLDRPFVAPGEIDGSSLGQVVGSTDEDELPSYQRERQP